jgi:hypothetical protein
MAAAMGHELIVEYFDRASRRLRPPWVFYAVVMAMVILPMLALATLANLAGEPLGGAADVHRSIMSRSGASLLLGIVIVPLIETLIMWAVIATATSLSRNSDLAIVLAAAVMVLLHYPGGIGRVITTAWPFVVWGAVLRSHRFESRAHGFLAVYCLHAVHNAMVISFIYAIVDFHLD